jgi:hypothetical protein
MATLVGFEGLMNKGDILRVHGLLQQDALPGCFNKVSRDGGYKELVAKNGINSGRPQGCPNGRALRINKYEIRFNVSKVNHCRKFFLLIDTLRFDSHICK